MKTSYRLWLFLAVFAGLTWLVSCTPSVIKKSSINLVTQRIMLNVTGNPSQLSIVTPGMGNCRGNNPQNGCVSVPPRETALITFELNARPVWRFSEIKICSGGTKATQDCSLEEWQRSEFYASDSSGSNLLYPDDQGVIDLTQLSATLTEFVLFDFNSVEHDFFYTIMVCDSAPDPTCIPTDPPIQNGGRR